MLRAYQTYEAKTDTAILHPKRLQDPIAHAVSLVEVSIVVKRCISLNDSFVVPVEYKSKTPFDTV